MSTVYEISIQERILSEKKRLSRMTKAYDSLKKKDTEYAHGLFKLMTLQQRTLTIYTMAPRN